ncbi:hypothetical protein Ocin01_15719 [Orchesella cincta]|uniref:CUB domain-containing protein n=1 Tax=Orchesella cincta TaxID=48709 RepID=A0A1D2MDC9_ORCCI|nr:hypothetical protein Ocin01_15719 [Orchesella cincta]
MNLTDILVICICALLNYTKGENVDNISEFIHTHELPHRTLTECGDTITANNGTIQYKLNQTYDANELCVFMIRFESGFVETTFTLDSNGFSDSDFDAISIFRDMAGLGYETNLGLDRQTVSFFGYGAIVVFRTNSSLGTGFQLSFTPDLIVSEENFAGNNVLFDDESESPLSIPFPSNYIESAIHNYFCITSASKVISEPDTFLKLNVTGFFGDVDNSCNNMIEIHSFLNQLKIEKLICGGEDDGVLFEFATRGIFFVFHRQANGLPITTGEITWEKVSTG